MTTIEDPVHQVQLNQAPEPDSDTEDDPGKLLNAWLGQLNQKVNIFFSNSRCIFVRNKACLDIR